MPVSQLLCRWRPRAVQALLTRHDLFAAPKTVRPELGLSCPELAEGSKGIYKLSPNSSKNKDFRSNSAFP